MSQFDEPEGAMPPPDDDARRPLEDAEAGAEQVPADEPAQPEWSDAAHEPHGPHEPQQESLAEPSYEAAPAADPHAAYYQAYPVTPEPHEALDRRVVIYWLLSGSISWVILAGLLGGGATFVWAQASGLGDDAANWQRVWNWVLPIVATLGGLLLLWALISPPLAYSRWRFSVDSELLLARYGILFIEEKAIPISRLQHVDLYRGFLERMFGLTTLIVFTAGTEGAHFRLPGLSLDRARQLRDQILAARGDDVI